MSLTSTECDVTEMARVKADFGRAAGVADHHFIQK